ncbi:MAG: N-acetylglucosamine kinase [Bacillota bacterium]
MFYLGVDGGGTKTGFILIDDRGRIISYTVKSSCCYTQVQFEGFQKILREGITEVCAGAGIGVREINYSFLGLPAFGEIEKDAPILESIVSELLESGNFKCGNDVEAGWAGSLACRPGINIVAGTGAIGFGRDDAGNTARASGWGEFCGDEGSAYWLGKQLISLFGKEADGREEKTPLYDIVRQELGIFRDFDLIAVVYDDFKLKRDEIAKLAVLVYKAALRGDAKALALYDRAAYEHSLTVRSIIRQLCFSREADILVSYSGGVFKAGELILDHFQRYLQGDRVRLIKPVLQPVTGAALYAMILDGKPAGEKLIAGLQAQEAVNIPK